MTAKMLERDLYVAGWYNHFIIAPPLIITEEEVDRGIHILDETLEAVNREVRSVR